LQQANSYTDQRFNQLNQRIGDVQKEARQAAAIGLAASSLRYDDRPGKLSAAVGGGLWKGYAAGSMGLGYTSQDQRVRANVSGTTTGDSWGIGAGISFTLN
jgi:autotransporter adhesin